MDSYLRQQQEEMLKLIEQLVNIESGSYVKEGVDRVGRLLKEKYEEIGFTVAVVEEEEVGNHLLIQHHKAKDPKILLVGHCDTVFPEGTVANRPFHIEGDRAYGPGVVDMKSSLVSLLYAIKALQFSGSKSVENLQIILNSDEEIGSPTSRQLIEEHSVGKDYALIIEPARANGSIVTARRGGGIYELIVKGKAAHAGIEPEKGRSAIEELAHKILALHELTDDEKGIFVNVGVIGGGTAVNTISPEATALIDIRISKSEQAETLDKRIREILSVSHVPGTSLVLQGGISRPPMEKTKESATLLEVIQEIGKEIGLNIVDTATGGGGDGSFTSATGVPTIDGLGPVGGKAHSEEEYVEIDSIPERTWLLAKTIERLSTT